MGKRVRLSLMGITGAILSCSFAVGSLAVTYPKIPNPPTKYPSGELGKMVKLGENIIMRPLHSKRLHSSICFFIGEANFCRINRLIQGSLTKHMGKQMLPAGKADIGQSSRNKNSQANLC